MNCQKTASKAKISDFVGKEFRIALLAGNERHIHIPIEKILFKSRLDSLFFFSMEVTAL